MSVTSHYLESSVSFRAYLLKNGRNRILLCTYLAAIIIQFAIFKYYYPYASYIHGDSFSYINAANLNLDINTYMIGYSRFIRLFSVFTTSDTALVAFQYLLIQCSAMLLLGTLFYFFKIGTVTQIILVSFTTLNPLFLYLANLISSDCLFASLSLLWFSTLLWIINRPSNWLIMFHTAILCLTFTVRYNALIYPFISAVAFWISSVNARNKIIGIGVGTALCALFVLYTSSRYKELTGKWQYSPFSGWQFANNAMYAYRYVDRTERKAVPKQFASLHKMINEYFDSTTDTKIHPTEAIMASTYYMWSPGMPLIKYREKIFKTDSSATEFRKWATMGPFLKSYGLHIIREYPWHFARYFLWPNANKYYAPPIEFLETYNSGQDSVSPIAKQWFEYRSRKVFTRAKSLEIHMLDYYPILFGVINVVMLLGLLSFALLQGFNNNNHIRYAIILAGITWLANAGFTIGASSAALRFQSFPIIMTTVFSLILLDWLWGMARTQEKLPSSIPQPTKEHRVPNEAVI